MRINRQWLASILFITSAAFAQQSVAQISLDEAHLTFSLPNNAWSLMSKRSENAPIVYIYKREAITNKDGMQIIPNIAFIIEDVPDSTDLIAYSTEKRINMPFDVKEVFISTDKPKRLNFLNAVGYKGTYHDEDSLSHTVYMVHLINKNKGVQVIMDITSDLFPDYEKEFLQTMLSIKRKD